MDGQSMTRRDFKWPFPKPITFKPAQPPLETKPSSFYMYRFVPAYCHCDTHQYDAEMNQYQALAKREAILVEDLTAVQNKMTELSNGILDHPCDDDDTKLQTIYQTDYAKRKFKVPEYRKFMADLDSKVGDPIKPPSIGLSQGYRDPTSFRYTAIIRPTIETPPAPSFAVTPETVRAWGLHITGQSEYQDTISKMGAAIQKTAQQYAQPLPSSRRRFGDPCK